MRKPGGPYNRSAPHTELACGEESEWQEKAVARRENEEQEWYANACAR